MSDYILELRHVHDYGTMKGALFCRDVQIDVVCEEFEDWFTQTFGSKVHARKLYKSIDRVGWLSWFVEFSLCYTRASHLVHVIQIHWDGWICYDSTIDMEAADQFRLAVPYELVRDSLDEFIQMKAR